MPPDVAASRGRLSRGEHCSRLNTRCLEEGFAVANLETVFADDTTRRNFAKIEELYARLATLEATVLGGGSGTAPAQARVFNSANISINNATFTALTFDSERWDTGNFHSTSSNTSRLTVPTAGLYDIGGSVVFAANATGMREAAIRVNGSTFIVEQGPQPPTVTDGARVQVSTQYQLAAGDYVELMAFQRSGGALNVIASGNSSPEFWIVRLGSQA